MIGKSIFVSGLPGFTKKTALQASFQQFGEIKFLRIFISKNGKRRCINARVKFVQEDSAIKAFNSNKLIIAGGLKAGYKIKWYSKKNSDKALNENFSLMPVIDQSEVQQPLAKKSPMKPLEEEDKKALRETFHTFNPSGVVRVAKLASFLKKKTFVQSINQNHLGVNLRTNQVERKSNSGLIRC